MSSLLYFKIIISDSKINSKKIFNRKLMARGRGRSKKKVALMSNQQRSETVIANKQTIEEGDEQSSEKIIEEELIAQT